MRETAPKVTPPRVLIAIPTSGADGKNRLTGIFRYLSEGRFWNLILPSTHIELTAAFVRNALAEGLDGAIIGTRYDADIARILARIRLPTVLMHDSWMHRPNVSDSFRFVLSDHVAVGRLAARHFLSLGRFAGYGFVSDTERNRWGRARRFGFEHELRKHALKVSGFNPAPSSQRILNRDAFCRWLETRQTPLALFAASDRIAVQAIGCCHALGLAVPGDVAVLGVDNDETLISSCSPRLSSIVPDFSKAGYFAARLLEDILAGEKTPRTALFKPIKVIERASTAPLSPSVKLVEDARAYIANRATEGLTPAQVAIYLGVSRPLLDLRFRELRRGTVAGAIRSRQLDEVKRLLKETDHTTRQIGQLCGFGNERSLKNIFKRTFKMTMTDFRRRTDRQRNHTV